MFDNIFGKLGKRRRVDESAGTGTARNASASVAGSTASNLNNIWDHLFGASGGSTNIASASASSSSTWGTNGTPLGWPSSSATRSEYCSNTSADHNLNIIEDMSIDSYKNDKLNQYHYQEDMEIDPSPVPPPQEYSDNPPAPYHSESSMNFDYLHGLHPETAMDASNSGSSPRINVGGGSSPRHFSAIGHNSNVCSGQVDDSKALDRPFNLNERFVTVLDQLDARVEKFRKDALGLQEKRDFLLMSMDLIKSNDLMQNLSESEREEITCYIQRVNSRLSTVELHVRTVRDQSQEDSLSQINALIDMMITLGDPVMSRQRCQMYLNACCTAGESIDMDDGPVDKKFESVLLGCTLDDQKNIKKRLQALMGYLNKQIIHH